MANHEIIATGNEGDGGADIAYELVIDPDEGTAVLTCGGEVVWSSSNDPEYQEDFDNEFIDIEDDGQTEELFDWLVQKGYAPPGIEYDIVDLAASIDKMEGM
jgi:hypothetical protein